MAAQEWWDTVKREVRDMLVPGQARRMAGATAGQFDAVKRQDIATMKSAIIPVTTSQDPGVTLGTLLLDDDTATRTTTSSPTTHAVVQTTPTTTTSIRLTATPTATAAASEPETTGGMSVAAKAGIVIGALGAVLLLFVLVYFIMSSRRKKLARQRQQIEDDEKIHGPFADSAAIRPLPKTPNKAPRLSLRPVTQFLPNFNTQGQADRRASRGIALTLNPVSNSGLNRPTGGSAWERPAMRAGGVASPGGDGSTRPDTSASLYPTNPFHDKHRLPEEPVSPVSSMGSFDRRVGLATTSNSIPEPVSPIFGDDDDDDDDDERNHAGSSGGHLGVSSLTRKTSIRKDIPKPLDLTKPPSPLYAVPPSPAGTEYSMHSMAPGQAPGPSASAAAIAAAGGPSQSTVHRVQLDFKPTLQDEMGLHAGELVRLLHEYDDGWVRFPLSSPSPSPPIHPSIHPTR